MPRAGVLIAESGPELTAALLTLTVTLVSGVVVVAVVVVAALTPPSPAVVRDVVVLGPEPLIDPVEVEPRLAKAWLKPATPAILIIFSKT